MVEVSVRICDVCKRQGVPAQQYELRRLSGDKEAISLDLCARHAQPVEALLGIARGDDPGTISRSKRRTTARLSSPAEIEAKEREFLSRN